MKLHQIIRPRFIHVLFIVFLLGYLAVGLRVYADYGVPIDEYSQMDLGRVNYERVTRGSSEIQQHYDRHYGPAFEVPLYIFTNILAKGEPENVIALRHLGIFLFFVTSLICFYLLLMRANGHPAYGLLGAVLLGVYPRFFAESFYNTKDMAFVSATIFVLFAVYHFANRTRLSLLCLAVVSAFAIAVRAQGLLLLLVVSSVLLMDTKIPAVKKTITVVLYVAITMLATVVMFPLFWNNAVGNIVDFWRVSANSLGVPTYYFGKFYISPDLPWHYHFVWIGISAMLSVIVTSIFGIYLFITGTVGHGKKIDQAGRVHFCMLGIIAGTFITSVFFHPRSYDGWRHIYYVYPCLVGFAVYAFRSVIKNPAKPYVRGIGVVLGVAMFLDVVFSLRFILRNHPHQYVYFNMLAGGYSQAQKNFDFDYWGISQKQLLANLLSYSFSKPPTVYFQQILPYTERVMIPELTKKGMRVVESIEKADIYVTINRDFKGPPPGSFRKLYAVSVEGSDVSAVYVTSSFHK